MDKKKFKSKLKLIILWIVCLSFVACGKKDSDLIEIEEPPYETSKEISYDPNEIKENEEEKTVTKETEKYIYVHVCGAVKSPGVYKLKIPVRVYEAIESAGGITDEGCEEVVNQAREIVDGEQIYIPTFEEKESGIYNNIQTEEQINNNSGIININTASEKELMTLPGIGQAKASSIVNYRNDNGKFNSIEELKNIEGIKDGVFNKIKDHISI